VQHLAACLANATLDLDEIPVGALRPVLGGG
jgi:hypothetical protein